LQITPNSNRLNNEQQVLSARNTTVQIVVNMTPSSLTWFNKDAAKYEHELIEMIKDRVLDAVFNKRALLSDKDEKQANSKSSKKKSKKKPKKAKATKNTPATNNGPTLVRGEHIQFKYISKELTNDGQSSVLLFGENDDDTMAFINRPTKKLILWVYPDSDILNDDEGGFHENNT